MAWCRLEQRERLYSFRVIYFATFLDGHLAKIVDT